MRTQVTLLLLCILGATIALDANQLIIQQALNGVFEENQLVDPTTIMACIDSDTAAKVVAFTPKFFKKASSLFTIAGAITDAESFAKTLNPEVATCLVSNVEMLALIGDYDISKVNKATALAYITSHASTFTNEFDQAYKEFTSGKYNQLGNELGAFAHKIINAISSKVKAFFLQASNDANQDIIQQIINGFYEQNNLADPTTIVPCIDTTTAGQLVAFVPGLLKKASSALTIASAISSLQSFVQTLNPEVATCLKGNAEGAELATVFDISGLTTSAAISWATTHISTVTGEASTLNKLWSAGSYNSFGNNASTFAHTVIKQISGNSKLSASNDANQDILQQIINGFYEQNNLADPTTIVPCIDTTTAGQLVAFVPGLLKKASSALTIASAISSLQSFVQTLNPEVATCLKGNAEGAELATVFDISGLTTTAAISWATTHISTVTGEASTLNKLWSAGSYNSFGNNASTFAHTVIKQISGNSKFHKLIFSNDANQDILQQIINGFYEQNNLADPTTIVTCIDSDSAAKIVTFVPGFLKKASSALTIATALNTLQPFIQSLNPSIITCLQGNAEGAELATVFDISGVTQSAAISWATGHISSITGEASTLNKLWSAGSYNSFGNNASAFAHTVISQISGKISNESNGNIDTLQSFYNGIFSQQGLPNPTFIAQCYFDAPAADFVAFVPTFLKKASSALTINAAFTDLQNFTVAQGQKYPSIGECLQGNTELTNLSTALGVKNPATVQDTIKNYITANLFPTTSAFGDANKSWGSSNFATSGSQVSAWLKKALAKN